MGGEPGFAALSICAGECVKRHPKSLRARGGEERRIWVDVPASERPAPFCLIVPLRAVLGVPEVDPPNLYQSDRRAVNID